MGMSDDQVKDLMEWFANVSETKKNLAEKRRKAYEKNKERIQPVAIKEMSDEELEKRFLEYYKSGTGGKQSLNQIYRDRIIRDRCFSRFIICVTLALVSPSFRAISVSDFTTPSSSILFHRMALCMTCFWGIFFLLSLAAGEDAGVSGWAG